MCKTNCLLGTALVALLLLLGNCSKEQTNTIHYTIRSVTGNDSIPRLQIGMRFPADPSGTTKVLYDDKAWGQENLFHCIENVSMVDPDSQVVVEKDSGWLRITHPKDRNVLSLSYEIEEANEGLAPRDGNYRPVVKPSYFHVFSHNLFMLPEAFGAEGDALLDVEILWKDFPKGYTIHNSFGSNAHRQHLAAIPVHEFHSAIFVGGDFRVHRTSLQGNEVYLASRGDWIPFNDSTVLSVLHKTLAVQRDFWEDHSQGYFTVTLRPIEQEHGSSFQGTGLTNSFATAISNNEHTELRQLVHLFNHELQHNWIGQTIQNSKEEQQYWFSEGFTEYYTVKHIASNNISDLGWDYFMEEINATIRSLYASPVKHAPNSEINYDNFWSNRDYGRLPYLRGMLFAFYLDATIRADSEGKFSLDNVMLNLLEEAKTNGKKITHPHFLTVASQYLNGDITTFFKEHIEDGAWLPLDELFRSLELEFDTHADIFEMGFQLDVKEREVIAVDETSAAYRAGIRKGDSIGSRSIYYGDATKPIELTLRRDGIDRELRYLPKRKVPIPQLRHTAKNHSYFTP